MIARSLVDPDQYIGTVTFVGPSVVHANLPHATARPERRRLARGAVGDFVFIDCEQTKLLGRIIEVRLPDIERLAVEPMMGKPPEPHPIGRIQLLATVDVGQQRLQRGVKIHPRVGDGVFLSGGGCIRQSSWLPPRISLGTQRLSWEDWTRRAESLLSCRRKNCSADTVACLGQLAAVKAGPWPPSSIRLRRPVVDHFVRPNR